jgi:hypothetical protein
MRQAQHSSFLVYETPFCVWDWDIRDKNLRFLDYLDPGYFSYLGDSDGQRLEAEEDQQHASLAIRAAYHHALETLFTLLGAFAQAPDCVYGWVLRCQPGEIEALVNAVEKGRPICNKLGLDRVSWKSLSKIVHAPSHPNPDEVSANQARFAVFWSRMADEFVRENRGPEYNSIKHGLRVRAGGFTLLAGLEQSPGVPTQDMRPVGGGSQYGCTFLTRTFIGSAPKLNFRAVEASANWNPLSLVAMLHLIASSINNIISAAKMFNGVPPDQVSFQRPQDPAFFEAPWQRPALALGFSMDSPIEMQDIKPLDKAGILADLGQRGAKHVPDPKPGSRADEAG